MAVTRSARVMAATSLPMSLASPRRRVLMITLVLTMWRRLRWRSYSPPSASNVRSVELARRRFGSWVFAVGDLASKYFGASARAIEPTGVPRTDLDHAAVDAATAGRAVLEPERLGAAGQNAHAEAGDGGVPQEPLSLAGRHLRPCDPGLGQLFRH